MKKQLCKNSLARLCVSVTYMDATNLLHVIDAIMANRSITGERKRPLVRKAYAMANRVGKATKRGRR